MKGQVKKRWLTVSNSESQRENGVSDREESIQFDFGRQGIMNNSPNEKLVSIRNLSIPNLLPRK